MAAPDAGLAQYAEQARINEAAIRAAMLLWQRLDAQHVSASWMRDNVGADLLAMLAQAQALAAISSDAYADLALAQQAVTVPPASGSVVPAALAGVASDGRSLAELLVQPLITTAASRAAGATPAQAKAHGLTSLVRIVGTQVADAGRSAQRLSITTRGSVGWIRMLHPGACGRCAVLAGRWYRYNAAFDRHPHCLCSAIPAPEDTADEVLTDPMAYFRSLSEKEQDRAFTVSGAQAIRDGADVSQVVNARRGAAGLSAPGRLTAGEKKALNGGGQLERTDLYGRRLFITREGTTKRGVYGGYSIREDGAVASREMRGGKLITRSRAKTPRLMPESIYQIAADREDAIRLLTKYGYITSNLAEKAAQASAAARRAREAYAAGRTARGLA